MDILLLGFRWQELLIGSMLFVTSCGLEGTPPGAVRGGGGGGVGPSGGSSSSGGSDGGADSDDASRDAGGATSCSTDASYAVVAIGGTLSSPSMLLLSGTPGPTCANPHPQPDFCCSSDRRELLLLPEQQSIGAHPMYPYNGQDIALWTVDGYRTSAAPCYVFHSSYYWGCNGSGGGGGSCGDIIGERITAVEVMSIDDRHITLKERTGGDAGTWGPAYTAPRCP